MDTLEMPQTHVGRSPSGRSNAPTRRGPRPWHRPPTWLRAITGFLGVVAVASITAIMLSDRAPGVLERIFGDVAQRISERIDASERLPSTDQLPESDFIVHLGLWAGAAVLVGWALWTWRGLIVGALALLAASLVVEAAQGVYSDTRAVEAHDAAANALGIGLGVTVAALSYLVWSAIVALGERLR
jgi:hypothetical protein